jgi:hypothetical protein
MFNLKQFLKSTVLSSHGREDLRPSQIVFYADYKGTMIQDL